MRMNAQGNALVVAATSPIPCPKPDQSSWSLEPMDSLTAFAAIGFAAVSWDGHFTKAGTRAFRHALDYREPFCQMPDAEMIGLLDELLELRREVGSHDMMLRAAQCLTPAQRMTAYAMASEIMRSDGPFQRQERAFLDHLALMLEISGFEAQRIDAVFEIFHARLTLSSRLTMPAMEDPVGVDVAPQPDPTVVH